MTQRSRYRPATDLVHLGRDPRRYLGAVSTPVFRTSTILLPTVADLERAARGEYPGLSYGLHGLPTVTDLQRALATLEGGYAALAVPSGLTATTLPLLALLKPGDHLLVTDAVYGPTRRFCENHLRRLGIDVDYYDPLAGSGIVDAFRPNTTLVFAESPASLTFEVQDLPAIAEAAHAHGAKVVLDNTWATPIGFRAFEHGVDVSVHAATKYIGGHSDVLLGAIVASAATFPALHRLWTARSRPGSRNDPKCARYCIRRCPATADTHCGSAISQAPPACSAWCSNRSTRPASQRCSTACGSSAWGGAGAASRA